MGNEWRSSEERGGGGGGEGITLVTCDVAIIEWIISRCDGDNLCKLCDKKPECWSDTTRSCDSRWSQSTVIMRSISRVCTMSLEIGWIWKKRVLLQAIRCILSREHICVGRGELVRFVLVSKQQHVVCVFWRLLSQPHQREMYFLEAPLCRW